VRVGAADAEESDHRKQQSKDGEPASCHQGLRIAATAVSMGEILLRAIKIHSRTRNVGRDARQQTGD
jgi:hypothetical protein